MLMKPLLSCQNVITKNQNVSGNFLTCISVSGKKIVKIRENTIKSKKKFSTFFVYIFFRVFISWLNASKPYPAPIQLIREDSKARTIFVQHMIEDRLDGSFSYFEFLQHLKQQSK